MHTGNVKTHAVTIPKTVLRFIFPSFNVPTPSTADVFVCVVLAGMPHTLANKRHTALAISEANPSRFSSCTISSPTDLIIFLPPTAVPANITSDTAKISPIFLLFPRGENSKNSPKNFSPSCAPCVNEEQQAPNICAHLKKLSDFPLKNKRTVRFDKIPAQKPMTVDTSKPHKTFEYCEVFIYEALYARAVPVRLEISAWLSLVGIPNAQVTAVQRITESIEAHSAVLHTLSVGNEARFLTVYATPSEKTPMINTPRKLNTAESAVACDIFMHFVPTHVATAFAASVAPLKKMTAKIKITAKYPIEEKNPLKKSIIKNYLYKNLQYALYKIQNCVLQYNVFLCGGVGMAVKVDVMKQTKELLAGNMQGAYFLYGGEEYLKRAFLSDIKKHVCPEEELRDFNINVFDSLEDKEDILSAFATLPQFADRRLVILYGADLKRGGKEPVEVLCALAKEAEKYDYLTFVIYLYATQLEEGDSDSKAKLAKLSRVSTVVYFDFLSREKLLKWINRHFVSEGFNISVHTATLIADRAACDMSVISNEISKLCAYMRQTGMNELDDYTVESITGKKNVFEAFYVSNKILKRDTEAVLAYTSDALKKGADPMMLMAEITSEVEKLYRIKSAMKSGMKPPQIASALGMHEYAVKVRAQALAGITGKYLSQLLESCYKADLAVKSTGADVKGELIALITDL